jgi:hypothetical protein
MDHTQIIVCREAELPSPPQSLHQCLLQPGKEVGLAIPTTALNFDSIGKTDIHGKRRQEKPGGVCSAPDAINFPWAMVRTWGAKSQEARIRPAGQGTTFGFASVRTGVETINSTSSRTLDLEIKFELMAPTCASPL